MKYYLLAVLWGFVASVHAEILHGIDWEMPLKSVKAKYPGADFKKTQPAWLKSDEAVFTITGQGMPGRLFVVFSDNRPLFRSFIKQDLPESTKNAYLAETNKIDDDALTVLWIRWIPESPIPLARARLLYGVPTCRPSPSDLTPVCIWENRALLASMSDDEKMVIYFETDFTKEEKRASWRKYFSTPLPEFLK
jgi:hypothetical protein